MDRNVIQNAMGTLCDVLGYTAEQGANLNFTNHEGEQMSQAEVDYYTDLIARLKTNKNIILSGAPGTGKTFMAKKIASIMNASVKFVQFHPSFDYTDFIEGLRPVFILPGENATAQTNPDDNMTAQINQHDDNAGHLSFILKNGIFKDFCIAAKQEMKNAQQENRSPQDYVFIIDEINRGDFSKIFGELFYAIDPGNRGITGLVTTQYDNLIKKTDPFFGGFYVPQNVYIIGTMNDIDRSVESMDFAIRRRFTWITVKPNERIAMWDDPQLGLTAEQKNDAGRRMTQLNNAICNIEELGEEYCIGPAYFLKLRVLTMEQLWEYHLEPLLKEYLRGNERKDLYLSNLSNAFHVVEQAAPGDNAPADPEN